MVVILVVFVLTYLALVADGSVTCSVIHPAPDLAVLPSVAEYILLPVSLTLGSVGLL